MKWIEISRDERDVLREEIATNWGWAFADLQAAIVEGRLPAECEAPAAAANVLTVLQTCIGWEVEREEEAFDLPDRPEVIQFLVQARSEA